MIAKHKNQTRYKILYSKLFQLCKNRLKKNTWQKICQNVDSGEITGDFFPHFFIFICAWQLFSKKEYYFFPIIHNK